MLNELYQLSKSLERNSIILSSVHPDMQAPANQNGLIVYLDQKSQVADIEFCEANDFSKLWSFGDGNHNKFPVIKLQFPILFDPDDSEKKREEFEKMKLLPFQQKTNLINDLKKLQLFIETEQIVKLKDKEKNINQGEKDKWKRLLDRNKEREITLQRKKQIDIVPFIELLTRIGKISDFIDILRSLKDAIQKKIELMQFAENEKKDLKSLKWQEFDLYIALLKGKKWDKDNKRFRSEIQIALELNDYDRYDTKILSNKMKTIVSRNLFSEIPSIDLNKKIGICSISGESLHLEHEKFPNPKLPLLGPSYIFSVNANTPCQTRYGKISTDIIPVGKKTSQSVTDAVTWITAPEREGITWDKTPGKDGSDLLIVYLEDKPEVNINFAKAFGNSEDIGHSESLFETATESLFAALKLHAEIKQASKLKLFILNKVDDGRRQVIQDRTFTIGDLKTAIQDWKKAAQETFTIEIPESKFAKIMNPYTPLPAEFLQVFQRQWTTDSNKFRQSKIPTPISMLQVYDLFLIKEVNSQQQCKFYLQLLWQRCSNLLIECGHALHKSKYFDTFKKSEDTRYILQSISVLNILLNKMSLDKETIMKNQFFLIGQFLSLTDTLHKEYCISKRDGSLPPQLLGNAHFQVVLQGPAQGFARLAERIPVYQAWANTSGSKLSRWALKHMGLINKQLIAQELPKTANDQGKAVMLMGYLAKIEGDENE